MADEIIYTDGNIEKTIEEMLKNETDLSSTHDIATQFYGTWAARYHLASIRSNAIRHLCFSGLEVLELGAGMGAMSRFIAESAKHLTAVEGTQQRFNCLKQRLRDLTNWDGFVCNFQNFKTEKKYDVVCFFGCWEYSGRYIKRNNPFEWAINCAKSFLKPNGVLLIAVENKNGLKYFSGSTGDHYGTHYTGICGYSEKNNVKTFSKKETTSMLSACGFNDVVVHHLSPDYKCTRCVLTDDFLLELPILAANIQSSYPARDYSGQKQNLFPERLALVSLAKSGLLTEFSNSYLFISSREHNSPVKKHLLKQVVEDGNQGFLYTTGRRHEVTTLIVKKNNAFTTHKQFKNQSTKLSPDEEIDYVFRDKPLYIGDDLSFLVLNYGYYGEQKAFLDLFQRFIEHSFAIFGQDEENFLSPDSFDATIRNAKLINGNFVTFDDEFRPKFKLTKSYYIFRNVYSISDCIFYLSKISLVKNLHELYLYLCRCLNVQANFESDTKQEVEVQNAIHSYCVTLKDIQKIFFRLFCPPQKLWEREKIKVFGIKVYSNKFRNGKRKIRLLGLPLSS